MRLKPITDAWDWQLAGLCRGTDAALFYAAEDETQGARRRREEAAVTVCQSCPVLERCREQALATREPYGVWGGLTEGERRRLLAQAS